ncbi:MAG: nicotinamide-nucleotide adenylyltransferase [Candidatus Aenigmatarchaeota archaeon]
MDHALFVGRFQPLHDGHMAVIEDLFRKHGEVTIVIGSANEQGTEKNPFSAKERTEMLAGALSARGMGSIRLLQIEDFHDDVLWTGAIKRSVTFSAVYSRNPWTTLCFKKNGVKVAKHRFFHERKYSGHRIRKLMAEGKDWKGLVPQEVYDYVTSIGGAARVRRIFSEGKKA